MMIILQQEKGGMWSWVVLGDKVNMTSKHDPRYLLFRTPQEAAASAISWAYGNGGFSA